MAKRLTKNCACCKHRKLKEQFMINKQQKDGLSCYCRECQHKKSAAYREKNREKIRANYRSAALKFKLKKFGLTLDKYVDMLIEQKGCCAICNISDIKYKRAFDIDHNHKTGKVRGLLCKQCNFLVGLSQESFLIINKLKQYLKKYK